MIDPWPGCASPPAWLPPQPVTLPECALLVRSVTAGRGEWDRRDVGRCGRQGASPEFVVLARGQGGDHAGAAGGIGRWLAAALGSAGAAVFVTDVDSAGFLPVQATLADAGIESAGCSVDLSDDDADARVVVAALERFGAVHILVNNAAVNRRMPILEMTPETWWTGSHVSICASRTSSPTRRASHDRSALERGDLSIS